MFDKITVTDFLSFFQAALRHYQLEENNTNSLLGDQYYNEITSLINFLTPLDYLEYLSSRRGKICTLSTTQNTNEIQNEEISWTASMKCDDFFKIIQFEILQQASIQKEAMLKNDSATVLKTCNQIEIFKKTWAHLNHHQNEFPNDYQKSHVLFQMA